MAARPTKAHRQFDAGRKGGAGRPRVARRGEWAMTETMADAAAETVAGDEPAAARRGRAIFAAILGNLLAWYDLALYGFFLPELSRLFFPAEDAIAQWIATAIVGLGFATRPVGAALLGSFGDRCGRRRALAAALGLM